MNKMLEKFLCWWAITYFKSPNLQEKELGVDDVLEDEEEYELGEWGVHDDDDETDKGDWIVDDGLVGGGTGQGADKIVLPADINIQDKKGIPTVSVYIYFLILY